MTTLTTSVLIPSYRRPDQLQMCLESLGRQDRQPSEVLVTWQGDDIATRDRAVACSATSPAPVRVVHSPAVGVVPAENAALAATTGAIILLIDDDGVAPPNWIRKHVDCYHDPSVGAVGGPVDNYRPDGTPFPRRAARPVGALTWYGKAIGNGYDHVAVWRSRQPENVDHVAGGNMSFRRTALPHFETGLRPYWQLFELDVCLHVRAAGYRVVFDYGNVVSHHPTSRVYAGERNGDLSTKVLNAAYNHGFVLSKWSVGPLRPVRLAYLLAVGSVGQPGLAAWPLAVGRFGRPIREITLLAKTWRAHLAGWAAGSRARALPRP